MAIEHGAREAAVAVRVTPIGVRNARTATLLGKLRRNRLMTAGLVIIGLVTLLAIVGPLVVSDPSKMTISERLQPPSRAHPFGTDEYGRDILSRVLHGARLSLLAGLTVATISQVGGIAVGLVAGYFAATDTYLMRAMDALMAIPSVLLAMGVLTILGPGMTNAILALSVTQLPTAARVVRASVLRIKELEFVEAARALGAPEARILTQHVLPNAFSPILVNASFVFASAVTVEAILSFLGLGAAPPTPTWGNMLSEARNYITDATWYMVFPGLALGVTVLGLNLLGDGLRDQLDPRLR
jgi:peptide/nickel transport system permease protein